MTLGIKSWSVAACKDGILISVLSFCPIKCSLEETLHLQFSDQVKTVLSSDIAEFHSRASASGGFAERYLRRRLS